MLEIVIDKNKCTGCAYCILSCPQEVFDFDYDTTKPFVANISECIVCRNCVEECPKKIIEVKLVC